MPTPASIRILAPAQQTGDLFGRLVADLFLALGYDQPRLNIHKAGREIDIQAKHRTEPRSVRAECKATAKPIGGDAINKFAGALERERQRSPQEQISGYFVSLSGFTESAREQELEGADPPRLTMLDGPGVIGELIAGRIIVSRERALERAGRCASKSAVDLRVEEQPQLLAHGIGWVWAVRFRRHGELTHLALIHADGEALSPTLAKEIFDQDRGSGGDLHRLAYLEPETDPSAPETRLTEARQAYLNYLEAECGGLELEGLPADQDVGSRRLRLESLFVPLRLLKIPNEKPSTSIEGAPMEQMTPEPQPVGEALAAHPRLAILALPGGGKTTLIKRLAVAYAFPARRTQLGDRLPDREWFPLLLRCRQLRGHTGEPIIRLLGQLAERAELGDLMDAFKVLVQSTLREGRALLLVDGLDEISDPGERVAFVTQVRTFLSTYPTVDTVITSREAGFRPVAGALAGHCVHYRIAEFDRADIERLTVAWHREVIGNRPEVEAQARELAVAIWEADRIRRLAVNPLLLTTLLLVKRWVGQLPNRRTVLYDKAIEVLLWTWNVQGYEQLDLQEVVPQLAFVAWTMMEEGVQRISRPRLRKTLQAARKQMPDVLAHAALSVDKLIERVEERSSLLVLAGHEIEDGQLVPIYEFQHLTFQEFLAAKALVEGYYPDQSPADTLASKLEPHFAEEAWKEAIPLAAALAGRKAAELMERLVKIMETPAVVQADNDDYVFRDSPLQLIAIVLTQCLLDDVQVGPALVDRALLAIAYSPNPEGHIYRLACGKYGQLVRDLLWQEFSTGKVWLESSIGRITLRLHSLSGSLRVAENAGLGWPLHPENEPDAPRYLDKVKLLLQSHDRERAHGLLSMAMLAYGSSEEFSIRTARVDKAEGGQSSNSPTLLGLARLMPAALSAVHSLQPWEQFSAAWALAWLMARGVRPADPSKVIKRLLNLLVSPVHSNLRRVCAWALSQVPPPEPRVTFRAPSVKQVSVITSMLEVSRDYWERSGAVASAFYWRKPWNDQELTKKLEELIEHYPGQNPVALRAIFRQLVEPTEEAL